jgi:hypothetical protein
MSRFPESHRYLLDTKNATLATIGRDGFPQQTEIWFLHEDSELDLENPFKYLEIRGTAVFEEDDDYEFARRVGAKYGGADLREHDQPGDKRVKVILEPVNVYPVDMTIGQS